MVYHNNWNSYRFATTVRGLFNHLFFFLLNYFITYLVNYFNFQVKREAFVEELEQFQINAALAEGRTPQELANSGLTSAIQPKVLN